jgi:GntR family transcriptional regulator
VETIVPFVTTLTGDPKTASGGEGTSYQPEAQAQFRKASDTPPQVGIEEANAEMASELGVDQGTSVVSRHQQRFIDGTPWSLQTSFYPMDLVESGAIRLIQAGDIIEGTVKYLRMSAGIKQAGYRDTITVRAPDVNETMFFRLPDDGRVSVIEQRRTAYTDDGRAVRLTVSVYPADRNQFSVVVGQVPDSARAADSLAEEAAPPESGGG